MEKHQQDQREEAENVLERLQEGFLGRIPDGVAAFVCSVLVEMCFTPVSTGQGKLVGALTHDEGSRL